MCLYNLLDKPFPVGVQKGYKLFLTFGAQPGLFSQFGANSTPYDMGLWYTAVVQDLDLEWQPDNTGGYKSGFHVLLDVNDVIEWGKYNADWSLWSYFYEKSQIWEVEYEEVTAIGIQRVNALGKEAECHVAKKMKLVKKIGTLQECINSLPSITLA